MLFAATLGQSACSDSDTTTTGDVTTTTSPTTTTGVTMPTSTTTTGGMGGAGATGGGGAGANGGSGGGGMMNSGTDLCPGEAINIANGFQGTFIGDTSLAAADYASVCEVDSGPEVVYQLNIATPGTFSLSALALDGQDLSIYMREACTAVSSTVFCRNHDTLMEQRGVKRHLDAGTYHLFVDTEGQVGGRYTLDIVFADGFCGDGVKSPTEQCDDANGTSNDGCDNCVLEAAANDTCADPFSDLLSPGSHVYPGNNFANTDNQQFQDGQCQVTEASPGGPDRVYDFTPQVDGTLRLRLGWDATNMDPSFCEIDFDNPGCLESVLHVRHAAGASGPAVCSNLLNQIACDGSQSVEFLTRDITIPVIGNEHYYVFVDSYYDGGANPEYVGGPYFLHVELTPD